MTDLSNPWTDWKDPGATVLENGRGLVLTPELIDRVYFLRNRVFVDEDALLDTVDVTPTFIPQRKMAARIRISREAMEDAAARPIAGESFWAGGWAMPLAAVDAARESAGAYQAFVNNLADVRDLSPVGLVAPGSVVTVKGIDDETESLMFLNVDRAMLIKAEARYPPPPVLWTAPKARRFFDGD